MKRHSLILLGFLWLVPGPRAEDVPKDLAPFVISGSEPNAYRVPTIEEELEANRKRFGVAALERPEPACTLSFQIYVIPQLIGRAFYVGGKVSLSESSPSGGRISLRWVEEDRVEEKDWDLTSTQAAEVYTWFSDAQFIGPKTPATVPAGVLDGVLLVIDGFVDGRNFKIARNAYDSLKCQGFYMRVDAFRVWKGLPNLK